MIVMERPPLPTMLRRARFAPSESLVAHRVPDNLALVSLGGSGRSSRAQHGEMVSFGVNGGVGIRDGTDDEVGVGDGVGAGDGIAGGIGVGDGVESGVDSDIGSRVSIDVGFTIGAEIGHPAAQ